MGSRPRGAAWGESVDRRQARTVTVVLRRHCARPNPAARWRPCRRAAERRQVTLSELVALARTHGLTGSSAGAGPGVSRRPRSDRRRRSEGRGSRASCSRSSASHSSPQDTRGAGSPRASKQCHHRSVKSLECLS